MISDWEEYWLAYMNIRQYDWTPGSIFSVELYK